MLIHNRFVFIYLCLFILCIYTVNNRDVPIQTFSYLPIFRYVTQFAKTQYNDASLEIQIFTSASSIYLKFSSVVL